MIPLISCTKLGKQIDGVESQDCFLLEGGVWPEAGARGELLVSANVLFSDLGADDMGIPFVTTSTSHVLLCTLHVRLELNKNYLRENPKSFTWNARPKVI